MTRYQVLVPLLLVGCSVPSEPARSVNGQLSVALLSRLDNPAIVLRTSDGQRRVTRVARTGEFQLDAPVGKSVHLAVAGTTPSGALREDSTINWPNAWTRVGPGPRIELGVVRLRGGTVETFPREDGGVEDDGEDDGEDCHEGGSARSDLPYDAKIPLGATFRLSDSFLEKGPVPARIVSVTMEGGGTWRLAELIADTAFVLTQADCEHEGNRDIGRDRVVVTWENADGSTESDHLDLRYCEGSTPPSANARAGGSGSSGSSGSCPEVCEDENENDDSDCDDEGNVGLSEGDEGAAASTCTEVPVPPTTTPGPAPAGAPCTTTADCGAGLACFQSICVVPIN